MLNIELLKKLTSIPSPSGFTHNQTLFLKEFIESLGLETFQNHKGNVFTKIKGESNYTITLAAHIDTLGLMVRSIDPSGKIYFTNIGGPILNTYDGEYCKIHTRSGKIYTGTVLSTSPSVHVYKDANTKERNINTMYIRIDELVKNKKDVEDLGIMVGDYVSIDAKFEYTQSGYIKTRFLDDLASAFLLLSLLKELKEQNITPKCNLQFAFTTYEEVGHGCSNLPQTDELLVVDM